MGRQIEFYMTDGDELAFLAFLAGIQETRIEQLCVDASEPTEHFGLGTATPSGRVAYFLWRPGTDPPPQRHSYGLNCIDVTSQGLEFSRTSLSPERVSPGRVWFDTRVARPDSFMKWYQQICSWIKKRSQKDGVGRYWTAAARERWPDLFAKALIRP